MGEKRTAPCATCPYRRETKRALWHRAEFENLQQQNDNEYGGHVFGCHSDSKLEPKERDVCIGWLLDQRRNGVSSIQFRLKLICDKELAARFRSISEDGLNLYSNVEEMFRANYPKAKAEGVLSPDHFWRWVAVAALVGAALHLGFLVWVEWRAAKRERALHASVHRYFHGSELQ